MISLDDLYDVCPLCGDRFIARRLHITENGLENIYNVVLQECENKKCKFEFLEEPEWMSIDEAKRLFENNKNYTSGYKTVKINLDF